ncbi:MFS transporter [Acinetobacter sp. ANC 5054]|uniref:MFS transporter n=1 Tax=Acinetobacter sp. ANC 5054 TaxID=1977877 RepID=UPI000A35A947|nr:MFS transporter [Acinetobacter sp. ANC 5054]OTG80937.1 MFS transporter [Acinetobacter sp. ANC 5054]
MNTPLDISHNKALLWLMAAACGLCAGANYYCQPLIASIQQSFDIPQSQVALTVTFAQVSYALGLLFIVPLGDIVNKAKFIPVLMLGASFGLGLCALSNNIYMLWVGTVITGLFSVAAQVLIPLVTVAIRPEKIGQTVGFLMSGLLVGILLSTSLSGLLSNLIHWKSIYVLSAILMLILAGLLKSRLPKVSITRMRYLEIFQSMGQLLKTEPRLIYRSLIGSCAFAAMSMLFSTIAMLLTQPPFGLADVWVGIVTLVGVFGALSTQLIGRWADQGYNQILTWLGCSILGLSWGLLYLGGHSLTFYILGYGFINLGLAMVHSCNQNIIFQLNKTARSRVNSIYMTAYFIGGAGGSALGVFAWHHGGWTSTCLTGVGLAIAAAVFIGLDQIYTARSKVQH